MQGINKYLQSARVRVVLDLQATEGEQTNQGANEDTRGTKLQPKFCIRRHGKKVVESWECRWEDAPVW